MTRIRKTIVGKTENEEAPLPAKKRATRKKITFANLEYHHCRWPVGDPRDPKSFHFCGKRIIFGESYCKTHIKIAYTQTHGPITGRKKPSVKRRKSPTKRSGPLRILEDA